MTAGDRVLRLLGVLVAAGAVICAALWWLEFVSTCCAFAAVAGVVLADWVRRAPETRGAGTPADTPCPCGGGSEPG